MALQSHKIDFKYDLHNSLFFDWVKKNATKKMLANLRNYIKTACCDVMLIHDAIYNILHFAFDKIVAIYAERNGYTRNGIIECINYLIHDIKFIKLQSNNPVTYSSMRDLHDISNDDNYYDDYYYDHYDDQSDDQSDDMSYTSEDSDCEYDVYEYNDY